MKKHKNRFLRAVLACFSVIFLFFPFGTAAAATEPEHLPEPVICTKAEWDIQQPSQGSAVYTCKKTCEGDWKNCIYTVEGEKDLSGCLLPHLAFTVQGMGGQLRWSCKGTKTLFLHVGGPGTGWWVQKKSAFRELEEDGIRLVELKWEKGAFGAKLGEREMTAGWFSRTDEKATTLKWLSGRPGAMMKWMHDHLSDGHTFGTVGCSGGGAATFAPVYWYHKELSPILDYQFVSGAAVFWDIEAWCGVVKEEEGRCENDPLRKCTVDKDCEGEKAKCARLEPTNLLGLGVRSVVDYILGGGEYCRVSKSHPKMSESSFRYTEGSLNFQHQVDLDFGEGGLDAMDDTLAGSTGNLARIYEKISGPKQWFDNEGIFHCGSTSVPKLIPVTLDRIRKGMKVEK